MPTDPHMLDKYADVIEERDKLRAELQSAQEQIKKQDKRLRAQRVELNDLQGKGQELQAAQERLGAVDVQLGRHLGEIARRIFWKGVDTYLAQHTEEPELTEAEKAEEAAAIPEADYCSTWQADRDQIRSTLQEAGRRHLSEGWLRAKVTQLLLQANELEAELQVAQELRKALQRFYDYSPNWTFREFERAGLLEFVQPRNRAAQRTEEPRDAR